MLLRIYVGEQLGKLLLVYLPRHAKTHSPRCRRVEYTNISGEVELNFTINHIAKSAINAIEIVVLGEVVITFYKTPQIIS